MLCCWKEVKAEIVGYMKQRYGDLCIIQPLIKQPFPLVDSVLSIVDSDLAVLFSTLRKVQPEIVDENVHHIDELLLSMDDDSPQQGNGDQGK